MTIGSSPSSCSPPTGFDDHLPATGVAVHLIDGGDATRTQTPLVGVAPFDDLLDARRDVDRHGWQHRGRRRLAGDA